VLAVECQLVDTFRTLLPSCWRRITVLLACSPNLQRIPFHLLCALSLLRAPPVRQISLEVMRKATVVGMTTSGAAKVQRILRQLGARVLVVEEAAGVLVPPSPTTPFNYPKPEALHAQECTRARTHAHMCIRAYMMSCILSYEGTRTHKKSDAHTPTRPLQGLAWVSITPSPLRYRRTRKFTRVRARRWRLGGRGGSSQRCWKRTYWPLFRRTRSSWCSLATTSSCGPKCR
jgi:hypothetical protein